LKEEQRLEQHRIRINLAAVDGDFRHIFVMGGILLICGTPLGINLVILVM